MYYRAKHIHKKKKFTFICIISFMMIWLVLSFFSKGFSKDNSHTNSNTPITKDDLHNLQGALPQNAPSYKKERGSDNFQGYTDTYELIEKFRDNFFNNFGPGFGDEFDKDISEAFKQMQTEMESSFGADLMQDFFSRRGQTQLKINTREDDKFKYIEIESKDLDKNTLNIDVKDGIVSISGEIKQIESTDSQMGQSKSISVSKFSQKLNVPDGVNESGLKIETEKDKVILKFPRMS